MKHPTVRQLSLHLAWEFNEVLPGVFERNRKEVAGVEFPIIAPLPTKGKYTPPLRGANLIGPYLYFVLDQSEQIKYIGAATEDGLVSPLTRWIRPDKRGIRDYWAHGTNKKSKSTVAWVAEGIQKGLGPFSVYFSNYEFFSGRLRAKSNAIGRDFSPLAEMSPKAFISNLEHALVYKLQPEWNVQMKRTPPPNLIEACSDYWSTEKNLTS